MDLLSGLLEGMYPILPTGIAIFVILVALYGARAFFEKRLSRQSDGKFRLQLMMLALWIAAIVVIIMVAPVSDLSRSQLLGLLGIVLSAAIALSSTTFLGNIMAGVTLRAVRAFRAGDFIRVGEHFGRVSERGLFHVEIQTEDRDLTTLPNLYLVTQPVTVVHTAGTIISSSLSLGYDVPRSRIEKLLKQAAEQAELQEPFVQILELGDFSVTYRVAGLYKEFKHILSKGSELRGNILDVLHGAGVEIVSPSFMNTRAIAQGKLFISEPIGAGAETSPKKAEPESIVFDKAEHAELLESLSERHRLLADEIKNLEKGLSGVEDETEKEKLRARVKLLQTQQERIGRFLASELDEEKD